MASVSTPGLCITIFAASGRGGDLMIKAEYIDHMGTDLLVSNAARVSFSKWREEFDDSGENLPVSDTTGRPEMIRNFCRTLPGAAKKHTNYAAGSDRR